MNSELYVNPIEKAANAFLIIWHHLPLPVRSLFYVSLILVVIWALYSMLSR